MIKILKNSLIKKYFRFSGRASRKEYWILYLFTYFIMYLLVFFKEYPLVMFAIFLIFIIPYISLSIRRLHESLPRCARPSTASSAPEIADSSMTVSKHTIEASPPSIEKRLAPGNLV